MQESSQKQNLDLLYPDKYFTALITLGIIRKRFLGGSVVKNRLQCSSHRRHRFDPWVGKILWRKAQ